MKVLYEELLPYEFLEHIKEAPIAYLPLGTLEWHGEHMPLGSDGIQSQELFIRLAKRVGGVVLPKLFLGPDFAKIVDGQKLIGMDFYEGPESKRSYPDQILPGSAYYIKDDLYRAIIFSIAEQLARAGIRILVAHGHGPSSNQFRMFGQELLEQYGLYSYNCFFDEYGGNKRELGFQVDHGSSNETSIVMACRPELVDMSRITAPRGRTPLGLAGIDPREAASAEIGEKAFAYTIDRMEKVLNEKLEELGY